MTDSICNLSDAVAPHLIHIVFFSILIKKCFLLCDKDSKDDRGMSRFKVQISGEDEFVSF